MNKKLKVIDLFCGCGGLSEGFRMAGYEIVKGLDFNSAAIKTYQKNFGEDKGVCVDLTDLNSDKIKTMIPDIKNVNVIIGGPPCQGFSSANRQDKCEFDDRNKLFMEFLKFVDEAQPEVVLIENVKEILTKNNGYAKKRIEELFAERGYFVNNKLLKASDYGVPQKRVRNFFVMLKSHKFDFDNVIPDDNVVTVKEALSSLYSLETENNTTTHLLNIEPQNDYEKYLRRDDNIIENHEIKYPSVATQEKMKFVPQGGNWKDIPEEMFKTQRNNRHSTAYKRLAEEDVSCTIDTGNNHSNYYHPLYHRIPTVRESARIQSFKDSFVFEGSRTEQYRQVGNAVPPLLAYKIALAIKKELDNDEK